MNNPKISIIAAIGSNRELGKNNKLLWHLPEDLKRFKQLTIGHTVVMGRKTFESIGRPLPRRFNIVITRDKSYKARGCIVVYTFEEALHHAWEVEKEEIFVIGGGQIYEEAMKYTDRLLLTLVKGSFEADTFFPDYSMFKKIIKKEEKEENGRKLTLLELVK